jgi:hypothetical protein
VVGGSFDVVVGSQTDGRNKPCVKIEEDEKVALYLGSIVEVKSSYTQLATNSSDTSTFDTESEDLKLFIQPMLEVMAFAQMAEIPNAAVPIVNFVGTKYTFRPLLYFKNLDIILSTPRVLHLRRNQDTIDALGLMAMFTFVNFFIRCRVRS